MQIDRAGMVHRAEQIVSPSVDRPAISQQNIEQLAFIGGDLVTIGHIAPCLYTLPRKVARRRFMGC
jgi:hypothetical protein